MSLNGDGIRMTTAYFDTFAGAAGDMIVAALLDAGASEVRLRAVIASLGLSGYAIEIEKTRAHGFACTRFHVKLDAATAQPHRHLKHILKILEEAALTPSVRERAAAVFRRLAEAEARVHGCAVEAVHFHEVGAVDAIIDVVAAAAALEELGVRRVECSPIPTGRGTVVCAHGVMPVPAPATAEMLVGVPLAACDEVGEMTTPTGAALLTTMAAAFGPLPSLRVERIGYGAGTRTWAGRPNLLRVFIGRADTAGETETVTVLETQLDDTTGQAVAFCCERLLDAGVLDVWSTPIYMKKGRPGVMLTALCEPGLAARVEDIIFAETPTLGVRRATVQRRRLDRRHETVSTPFGLIRVKVAVRPGQRGTECSADELTASPEYEDCRAAALEHEAPLATVMDAAVRAWRTAGTGGEPT